MALFSFIFTHEVLHHAAHAGRALIEVGSEQGHHHPGEGGHQGFGCHRQQHGAVPGAGPLAAATAAAAAAPLLRAAASQQVPHLGVHHAAKQKEDDGRHDEEGGAVQHVPSIAGTLEHHRREDLLAGSRQQGHDAVTQNGLVADAEIQRPV